MVIVIVRVIVIGIGIVLVIAYHQRCFDSYSYDCHSWFCTYWRYRDRFCRVAASTMSSSPTVPLLPLSIFLSRTA